MSATSIAAIGEQGVSAAERRELVKLAHELAMRELAPRAAAIDAGERSALAECWREIVAVGLDRALLDERDGGAEIGIGELLEVIEELALGDAGVALSVLLCNTALLALPQARAAAVPAGARWAAVPVGWGAETTLRQGRLEGLSVLGLGAREADGIVLCFPEEDVPDRTNGARSRAQAEQPRSCPVLYLERETSGLKIVRDEHQLGLRGAPAATVRLALGAGTTVGVGGVVGVGGGRLDGPCLHSLLRLGAAAVARGIARRARHLALEYACAREQGGVAIIEHDAVRNMLSAMAVRQRCCAGAALSAAGSSSSRDGGAFDGGAFGIGDREQAIAAKIAATDAAVATTTDAVQVFGGTGYMRETGVEKLMRDAKCCQLFPEPGWVAQDMLMSPAPASGRSEARLYG